MEIGIDSFAAAIDNKQERTPMNNANAIEQLLARIEHADKMGLHIFGIGEHHRKNSWILRPQSFLLLQLHAQKTSGSPVQLLY